MLIGCLIATFPAVTVAPLLYRQLQKVKITGLRYHCNRFDEKVDISDERKTEIQGGLLKLIIHASSVNPNPDIVTSTGMILTGWGIKDSIHPFRVLWYKSEIDQIKVLGLKAIAVDVRTY